MCLIWSLSSVLIDPLNPNSLRLFVLIIEPRISCNSYDCDLPYFYAMLSVFSFRFSFMLSNTRKPSNGTGCIMDRPATTTQVVTWMTTWIWTELPRSSTWTVSIRRAFPVQTSEVATAVQRYAKCRAVTRGRGCWSTVTMMTVYSNCRSAYTRIRSVGGDQCMKLDPSMSVLLVGVQDMVTRGYSDSRPS